MLSTLFETILELSPDHLVDDAGVALDDLHDLGRDVFFDVVRHGDAVIAVGVHLQAVVIVESERFVLNHALVELEARGGEAVTAARVATVQNRHVVLFGHFVDGGKEAREVLLGIDVFFTVGAEQNVLALFEAEAGVNVARFDLCEVLVQNFGHGAAGYVRAFLGQTAIGQVAASMFGVGHVHIADDVHDAAVGLFGQAFVLAAIASFHVEDWDVH